MYIHGLSLPILTGFFIPGRYIDTTIDTFHIRVLARIIGCSAIREINGAWPKWSISAKPIQAYWL